MPVHIPPLFHAVDLQMHVYAGSLYVESVPVHSMQTVAFAHVVQLILQAKFKKYLFKIFKYNKNKFKIVI